MKINNKPQGQFFIDQLARLFIEQAKQEEMIYPMVAVVTAHISTSKPVILIIN